MKIHRLTPIRPNKNIWGERTGSEMIPCTVSNNGEVIAKTEDQVFLLDSHGIQWRSGRYEFGRGTHVYLPPDAPEFIYLAGGKDAKCLVRLDMEKSEAKPIVATTVPIRLLVADSQEEGVFYVGTTSEMARLDEGRKQIQKGRVPKMIGCMRSQVIPKKGNLFLVGNCEGELQFHDSSSLRLLDRRAIGNTPLADVWYSEKVNKFIAYSKVGNEAFIVGDDCVVPPVGQSVNEKLFEVIEYPDGTIGAIVSYPDFPGDMPETIRRHKISAQGEILETEDILRREDDEMAMVASTSPNGRYTAIATDQYLYLVE